ncbi:MAG TPA: hypothetical protein VGN64_11220 [Dyadobacter sp.]|nr:hypothetical protein [Dyadobacter sp.]
MSKSLDEKFYYWSTRPGLNDEVGLNGSPPVYATRSTRPGLHDVVRLNGRIWFHRSALRCDSPVQC